MAYDLKAIFSIQDNITAKLRRITQDVEKLDKAMKNVQRASQQVSSAFGNQASTINNTTTVIVQNTNIINNNTNALNNNANAASQASSSISSSMNKMAIATAAGFAAITAGAAASVKTYAEVEAELKRTAALTGASASQFTELENAAIKMGASSSKGMLEISESMSELGASGMDVNKIISAMPGIIKASEASGESLATAASVVSSSLNIWGLEASKSSEIADILTMSANVSAAGIDSLGEALKYAGAPAAALGMDISEVSAAIGVMVDSGIDGSSAGTALRASLLALNNPAKAQEKMMSKLGFSIRESSGEAKSLVDIVANMTEATKEMTAADRLATVGKLVGTEAASGFLALMSRGPDELGKMTDALRDSSGIAEETANKMNESLGASFKMIKSMVEATGYQIGKGLAPAVSRVVQAMQKIDITPLINLATTVGTTLAGAFDKVADNWSTLAPLLKPVLAGLAAFSGALALIGGGALIFTALGAVISFIGGPIGLIAVGVGAIGAAFYSLYNNVKPIKDFFVTLKQQFTGGLFTGILDRDKGAVSAAIGMANGIKTAFASVKEYLAQKVVELQPTIAMFSQIFSNVKEIAVSVFTSLWNIGGPIFSLLGNAFSILGDIAVIVFNNIISPAFLMLSEGAKILWSVIGPLLSLIGAALEVVGEVVLYLWNNAFAPFYDFVSSGMVSMAEKVMPILEGIAGIFDTIGSAISTAIGYVKGFADKIASIKVPDWVSGLGGKAMNLVSKVIPDGSHYNGIGRIPKNNYLANLHLGERVLTRFEADKYDDVMSGEISAPGVGDVKYIPSSTTYNTTNHSTTVNSGNAKPTQNTPVNLTVNFTGGNNASNDIDAEKIARTIAREVEKVVAFK